MTKFDGKKVRMSIVWCEWHVSASVAMLGALSYFRGYCEHRQIYTSRNQRGQGMKTSKPRMVENMRRAVVRYLCAKHCYSWLGRIWFESGEPWHSKGPMLNHRNRWLDSNYLFDKMSMLLQGAYSLEAQYKRAFQNDSNYIWEDGWLGAFEKRRNYRMSDDRRLWDLPRLDIDWIKWICNWL
jgi:hypothetical protein